MDDCEAAWSANDGKASPCLSSRFSSSDLYLSPVDFNLLSLPPSVAAFWTDVLNAADDKGVALLTFDAASSLLRASKPVHHARTAYELVSTHLVRQTADTTEYLPLGKLELDHGKQTVRVTINPELMPHLPAMRAEIERDDLLNTARIGSLHARALYRFCLLYTSPSPRDQRGSRMPSSA